MESHKECQKQGRDSSQIKYQILFMYSRSFVLDGRLNFAFYGNLQTWFEIFRVWTPEYVDPFTNVLAVYDISYSSHKSTLSVKLGGFQIPSPHQQMPDPAPPCQHWRNIWTMMMTIVRIVIGIIRRKARKGEVGAPPSSCLIRNPLHHPSTSSSSSS